MHLACDLLDKLLRDKHDLPLGRVDGVRIELRDGAPPRVTDVVLGGVVLAARVGPWAARLTAAVRRLVRGDEPTPTRVAVARLRRDGECLRVDDLDGRDTPALAWELWLRTHVVARAPLKGE